VRIAVLSETSEPVGGLATYLRSVIPSLAAHGHEIGFWHALGPRPDAGLLALPQNSMSWSAATLGVETALQELRAWQPDVLFAHGLSNPAVEARTLEIAPGVFVAHAYYGTCISGAKSFKFPTTTPCERTFGWPCVANFYPRRCGGWSPITMAREFRRQSDRLVLLAKYRAIVTLSSHMQQEYERHGLRATWIKGALAPPPTTDIAVARAADREWRLLFVGRMDDLKGGRFLIDALPRAAQELKRPLSLTFAGDGPARPSWLAHAAAVTSRRPQLHVEFVGWLARDDVGRRMAAADLLVLPSVWPEPFGLVGLEAARHGLPVAAFDVGGISDWLRPGLNGQLAPGDPPTPQGLADAIVSCLRDPEKLARLRAGAASVTMEFVPEAHVCALLHTLQAAADLPAA
jgi:glycosyltransferase involved in cell wall biosynthesis